VGLLVYGQVNLFSFFSLNVFQFRFRLFLFLFYLFGRSVAQISKQLSRHLSLLFTPPHTPPAHSPIYGSLDRALALESVLGEPSTSCYFIDKLNEVEVNAAGEEAVAVWFDGCDPTAEYTISAGGLVVMTLEGSTSASRFSKANPLMLEFDEDDWFINRTDKPFIAAQEEADMLESMKVQKDEAIKVLESKHPYDNNANDMVTLEVSKTDTMVVWFDPKTATEQNCDYLTFWKNEQKSKRYGEEKYTGTNSSKNWPTLKEPLTIPASKCTITFNSDGSDNDWGWKLFACSPEEHAKKMEGT